ncbi:GntR family transcriptional regulator [Alicyclobacillus sacchari]|uniref:GntR family transcriptional regulator n=1 Tax=Alicyclobacillus sacchari TaxID=392010 RepID=UPI001FB97FCD|nr:GntR family transcriptional regulator [Alicyclobacillus sacchari]
MTISSFATLGAKIADQLRCRIVSGTLAKGEVISENQLAREFGTSRSPVREALRELAHEGVIELARMGAVVKGLDANDVQELYDVRFLIERFAFIRVAAQLVDVRSALCIDLTQMIDKMELSVRHGNHVEFAAWDLRFHESVVQAAGHKRLWHMWGEIREIVHATLAVVTERRLERCPEDMSGSLQQHRDLVKALSIGDTGFVQDVVQKHLEETKSLVETLFGLS